jgi:hypothetical protein
VLASQGWWLLPLVMVSVLVAGPRVAELDPWTITALHARPCGASPDAPWTPIASGGLRRAGACWQVRLPRDGSTSGLPAELLLFGLHEEVEVSEDGRLVATPERARRQPGTRTRVSA